MIICFLEKKVILKFFYEKIFLKCKRKNLTVFWKVGSVFFQFNTTKEQKVKLLHPDWIYLYLTSWKMSEFTLLFTIKNTMKSRKLLPTMWFGKSTKDWPQVEKKKGNAVCKFQHKNFLYTAQKKIRIIRVMFLAPPSSISLKRATRKSWHRHHSLRKFGRLVIGDWWLRRNAAQLEFFCLKKSHRNWEVFFYSTLKRKTFFKNV